LANAEFGYLRPGNPKFYFEGITFAILKEAVEGSFGSEGGMNEDDLLLELQKLIFRYDVSMLKSEARLEAAHQGARRQAPHLDRTYPDSTGSPPFMFGGAISVKTATS